MVVAAQKINKTFVDNHKTPHKDIEVPDATLRGFIFRISTTGVKSYLVRARIKGGKHISYTIGKHGAPWNAITAREKAEEILCLMKLGIDPRDEAKEIKAQRDALEAQEKAEQSKSELTLASAFEQWKKQSRRRKDSTKKLYGWVLGKHLADWMDKPLAHITAEMVAERYNEVANESVGSAGNAFRALRMLFNWILAAQEDLPSEQQIISKNPVPVLSRRDSWQKLKPRKRYIAAKDLPAWFKAVDSLDNKMHSDYFKFLLVTGLRISEASNLKWKDVDFESKIFTVRDTKNRTDHTLPMTSFTESLLKRRKIGNTDARVFPRKRSGSSVRDLRYWTETVERESGVEFTCHDLRRTLSNHSMDLNISDRTRKMILNHQDKSDVTEMHYLTKSAEVMREPLQRIERHILKLAKTKYF